MSDSILRSRDRNGDASFRKPSLDAITAGATFDVPTETNEPAARRRTLAQFLRRKRDAISPTSVGLPATLRRRARGLLRDEVAQRAGVGVTWYTWLEQARDINPSRDLLERLATALQLSDAERNHLFDLARPDLSASAQAAFTTHAPEPLRVWAQSLAPCPAYIINGRWDVIAWNSSADELYGDFAERDGDMRNILRLLFLEPTWRRLFVDWSVVAACATAQFRALSARRAGQPEFARFIARLARDSDEFARLWSDHQLLAPQIWTKRFAHPALGAFSLSYAATAPVGQADDLLTVVYSALPSRAKPDADLTRST